MIRRLLVALCALLIASPAYATTLMLTGAGKPAAGGGGGYAGPGDLSITPAAPKAWYGLRGYSAALAAAGTTKSVGLIRASDSRTCDVLVATGGGLGNTANCSTGADNGTAWATWCNATTCKATTLYDQVGTVNAAQGTGAAQPTLTPNCVNTSLPCLTFAGAQTLNTTSTSTSQPLSISVVAIRTGAFTAQGDIFSEAGGNGLVFFNSAINQTGAYFGTVQTATASDSAWHALQFVADATTSKIAVDATQSGSLAFGGNAFGTSYRIGSESGGSFLTGNVTEVGLWTGDFTGAQMTALCHQQYLYWGTSVSC